MEMDDGGPLTAPPGRPSKPSILWSMRIGVSMPASLTPGAFAHLGTRTTAGLSWSNTWVIRFWTWLAPHHVGTPLTEGVLSLAPDHHRSAFRQVGSLAP